MITAIGPACSRSEEMVIFCGMKMLFICEFISACGGLFLGVGFQQVSLEYARFEV